MHPGRDPPSQIHINQMKAVLQQFFGQPGERETDKVVALCHHGRWRR